MEAGSQMITINVFWTHTEICGWLQRYSQYRYILFISLSLLVSFFLFNKITFSISLSAPCAFSCVSFIFTCLLWLSFFLQAYEGRFFLHFQSYFSLSMFIDFREIFSFSRDMKFHRTQPSQISNSAFTIYHVSKIQKFLGCTRMPRFLSIPS